MNKRHMRALAARIETMKKTSVDNNGIKRDADGFDMTRYVDHCGSPCCIAGWAAYLFKKAGPEHYSTGCKAGAVLGLSELASDVLFEPRIALSGGTYDNVTPKDAAKAIRLVAGGETLAAVIWASTIARVKKKALVR